MTNHPRDSRPHLVRITAIGAVAALLAAGLAAGLVAGLGGAAAASPVHETRRDSIVHSLSDVDALAPDDAWAVGARCPADCSGLLGYDTFVQHFDGTSWSPVPSGVDRDQAEEFYGVSEVSPHDVWAVGNRVDRHGGADQALVAHYDGTSWQKTKLDIGTLSDVLALTSDNVWAVGNGGIVHWSGGGWKQIAFEAPPSSSFGELHSLAAFSADDIWAAGDYVDSVKFEYHPLTEHWDGSAWHYVATVAPPKFAYFSSVGGSRTDDLWAVGSAENTTGTLAAHWDGTSWTEIDLPDLGLENAALTSVSAIAAKNVWAVGYNEAGDVTPLIAHWNGTAWRIVDNPTGRGVTELFGITALSGSDLWAVGERASRRTHVFREHYDGSAWSLG